MNRNLKFASQLKFLLRSVLILFILGTSTLFIISCDLFNSKITEETPATGAETTLSAESRNEIDAAQAVDIEVWDRVDPKEQIELTGSIEQFMETNPGIKVNSRHFRSEEELLDQFKAASLAGAGADILVANLESSTVLAESGVIKPVPPELIYSDTISGLAEVSKFEGETFIVPFRAFDFLLLFYNKEFIEKPPTDFTELIEYCKQVNNPNENTWGFLFNLSEPDWSIPFIGGYQDWIYDYSTGSISLDSNAMIRTLEFLINIYNEEKILPLNLEYEEINNAFKSGQAHMIINGNWAIAEYDQEELDFGIAKIPGISGSYKNPTPMIDGIGFLFNVNSYGNEFEASKKLVSYLMSEEIQLQWTQRTQTLPAIKSVAGNTIIQNNQIFNTEMQQTVICRGKLPENALRSVRDAIRLNLENVMLGNISPEEAATKMQEDAIKLLSGSTTAEEISGDSGSTAASN